MNRWGMVVDLNRCVGCQTCTIACKHANDTPPGVQWRRVLDVEQGTFPDVQRVFLVTGCQHCANPPCVPVCPTGATRQRADGLVTMEYDICIGCASCAVACPYQARTIVHGEEWYFDQPTVQETQVVHRERLGVANKCTFCIDRIDDAAERGLKPGVDLEVTPACAVACISQAIRFGDFADPDSVVSTLARDNRAFQMHAELQTDPQIRYLYETPGVIAGHDAMPADCSDERLSDPSNPLVGARQPFWDYRAAMNFSLGGLASGLAVVAALAAAFGSLPMASLRVVELVASAVMAVGLFFVFLKIGRKIRFWRVALRPQTSWMTRETYCAAVFYSAVAASWWSGLGLFDAVMAIAAGGFLLCQALMLYSAKGIPTWRAPLIPWMLIVTGLFEGLGALVLIALALKWSAPSALLGGGVVLAVANMGLWLRYRATAQGIGVGPLSRRDLAAISPALLVVGHVTPLVLFGVAAAGLGETAAPLAAFAGLCAIIGGITWKFTVITRACHQQGFALPKLPKRGSGKRAAPARIHGPAASALGSVGLPSEKWSSLK